MKRNIRNSFLFLLLLLAASCSRKIVPIKTEIHDTVKVFKKIRIRDTVFKVKAAKVEASLPLSQIGLSNIDKSDKQALLTVSTRNDTVYIDCRCDTMSIKAKLRDSLINTTKSKVVYKEHLIKEKYVPLVVKILAWIGGFALLIIGGSIVKKFWI